MHGLGAILPDLVTTDEVRTTRATHAPHASVLQLAAQLKQARCRKQWSLRQLGEVAGLSYETVRRIESGQVDPRWSVVVRLARILDVPASDLQRVVLPATTRKKNNV